MAKEGMYYVMVTGGNGAKFSRRCYSVPEELEDFRSYLEAFVDDKSEYMNALNDAGHNNVTFALKVYVRSDSELDIELMRSTGQSFNKRLD